MKKRIIITGGNGKDGIILSKLLLKKKYLIYSFVKKKNFIKIPGVKYLYDNLSNYYLIDKIIKEIKPFAIVHLAAKNISTVNIKNLNNSIIKNNKKIKFIFAGSSLMFEKTKGVANESSRFKANCYYSKYKIDAYNYIEKMKKKFKLFATTIILFNHDSKYRNSKFLFPRLVKYLKSNKLNHVKKIYSQNIFGDFSHAEDICNGIFLLIKSNKNPNKIIFSSNNLLRLNNLIDYGLVKLKIKKNITTKTHKKTIKLIGNNNLAKKLLKWFPKKNSLLAFKEILKN